MLLRSAGLLNQYEQWITGVGRDKRQSLTVRFSNSGVLQTYTRTPGLIEGLSSDRDKYPLKCYSSKIEPTRDTGFELITDTQTEPDWVEAFRANLEMPDGALLRQLTARGNIFGVRWQNYYLRFIGIVVKQGEQTDISWPFWRVSDADGNDVEVVQVWYRRAACYTSPVYCDIRWHPSHGETTSFPNIENAKRMRDVTLAWRGKILLEKIKSRGRPESSVSLTRAQFIERAPLACAALFERYGEIPTDVQIAEELHIGRATLYRYMDQYEMPLNQIRDRAVRLVIEPSSTPF